MLFTFARILRFVLFVAMLLLGAVSVPAMLFLLFLGGQHGDVPSIAVSQAIAAFLSFILVAVFYFVLTNWLRKQEDIFT